MGTCRKSIIFLVLLLVTGVVLSRRLSAQDVRIGIFDEAGLNTLVFHCTRGSYQAFGDSVFSRDIRQGELIYISLMGDKLVMMDGELRFGMFNSLELRETADGSQFRLKIVDPIKEPRNFTGDLLVNRFHGSVQLINELPLDEYIAGVVEAEGGPAAPLEFYKAQAILCRSFAIGNWEKHPGQDFNLCDGVHCQAYMGMNDENPVIQEAVTGTHGLVMVDQNFSLVSAIFHSNSGGETQRASDIWTINEDYLQAVVDPFSLGQRSSTWEKIISRESWKQYLVQHSKSDISKLTDEQLIIRQEHRKKYFIVGKDSLRLADIRTDLQLRSTFFTMEYSGDNILIHGKGYGHGVGMSQEGAMEMARQGFSYADILRFYFYNVQIIELSDLPASATPESFKRK
jgi:stage II sporulation protein D